MTGRILLITGAASGIGAATARRLATPGVRLLLHTRSRRDELRAVASACESLGAEVHSCVADLAERGAAAALVAAACERFGGLDQIVSNAGKASRTPLGEAAREDFDQAMASMAGAFFELLSAARAPLAASPRGAVVAVSSFVAHRFRADDNFPLTAAAKAAIEALTRAAAAQMASDRVTVNAVAPGYTRKDGGHSATSAAGWARAAAATPLGRVADPADVAALIAFLLGPEARHITGQVIAVDGGITLG